MPSQGCDEGRSVDWRAFEGHASPREVPSIDVRDEGHIGARPSMSTDQRIGRGMMGMDEATVRGWERR